MEKLNWLKKPRAVKMTKKVLLYDKLLQPYALGFSFTPQPQTTITRSSPSTPQYPLGLPLISPMDLILDPLIFPWITPQIFPWVSPDLTTLSLMLHGVLLLHTLQPNYNVLFILVTWSLR